MSRGAMKIAERASTLYDAAGVEAYGLAVAVTGDPARAEQALVQGLRRVVGERGPSSPADDGLRLMAAVCDVLVDGDPARRSIVASLLMTRLAFCRTDAAAILGVGSREVVELVVAGLRDVQELRRSA
ncbi:hypothetical protein [Nocardioides lianchengensis]|nr:hypothetical protein [Nocardioides lianchengensis]NYG10996.1 hypothetical protein [Nocardioides lianchengensis]